MQINDLKLKLKRPKKKVVGRGGKRGTYATRGIKGQKSRTGASINPLFEGGRSTLVDHMKKKRGFLSHRAKNVSINLSRLAKKFKDGETVSLASLAEKKLLDKKLARGGAKLLGGNQDFKLKLTIDKDILLSASAKQSIEKAGGKINNDQKSKNKEQ